jgi:hypothetical protein
LSHLKERKATNCLNCNAVVNDRYCSICGQENTEPYESAWHLVTHFFNDVTHFDGKFFSTLKLLIARPGFLSAEYKMGRRASYLNPIRMYVFTSAVFFLIFFSSYEFSELSVNRTYNGEKYQEIARMDSTEFSNFSRQLNKGTPMTWAQFNKYVDSLRSEQGIEFGMGSYHTKEQYDSVQKTRKVKDSWIKRTMISRQIEINKKYDNDQSRILAALVDRFVHSFPQMLFISLPLFAFLLKLMYSRSKDFYYVTHAIFSVHLYIFVFIVLLAIIGLDKLFEHYKAGWLTDIAGILYIAIFFYEYKAMRNFYGQRRAKTVLKYILLNGGLLFIVILLFTIFMLVSFLKA